ncbi:MAG TPA: CBS domain-containing protein [Nitrospirae bacterium]|nr:putative zinc metalloprotease Rip3 [bacterium BMS3Abin10]GBE39451.1 putative zinc metalloprotease Rip3 [bacterium BMS3Bbin08]HDH00310.1 CBS domain-containing protein [Nitrospirota bacterium]HDH51065.1 CBS domain-containing protein [Nitrospirota bacterium]HDK81951.1 CBS domain-containing protein [Nitrospirota bacterium]
MFDNSWQVAKVMGIPIKLHVSWFVIFVVITYLLATQYFPQVAPELPHATNWLRGAVAALLLFLSVVIHELSHSFVALRYNIPITSITLFIIGGVAQMKKEPSSPKIELKMALAGPLSSYLLCLIFFILFKLLGDYKGLEAIAYYLFYLNAVLGTFNLMPGFPMDGGRVLRALLWKRSGNYVDATKKASKAGQAIALMFMVFGFTLLMAGRPDGLWFLLIAWFLYTAAQTSFQQAAAKGILAKIRVRDFMTGNIIAIDSSVPVSEVVANYFLRYGFGGFPVTDGGKPVGIISLREIRQAPRGRWNDTTAGEVMQPFDRSLAVSEDDDISTILERMVQEDKSRFLVIRNDELVGLITRSGIARYLQIKGQLTG